MTESFKALEKLWLDYKHMMQDNGYGNFVDIYGIMAEQFIDQADGTISGISRQEMEAFMKSHRDRTDAEKMYNAFFTELGKRLPEDLPEEHTDSHEQPEPFKILRERYMVFKNEIGMKAPKLQGIDDAKKIAERYASKNTYTEEDIEKLIESDINNPQEPLLPVFIEAHDKTLKYRKWRSKFAL